jgi:gliding motility-associated-like protein
MHKSLRLFVFCFYVVTGLIFVTENTYAQTEPLENIKITIDFANDPSNSINVEKTTLRYNKDFAVILQMDNSDADIFTKVYDYFRGFNGNPGLFYTSGVINNPIHFKMGTNIFSFNSNGEDVHDTDPDKLTWSNIQTLWAAFFDVANQGMTYPPSSDDYYEVNRGISYSKFRFNEFFNQPTFNPDIYVIPDNQFSQISFAKNAGNLAIYSNNSSAVPSPFNATSYTSFYNFELKRSHITNNLFNEISQLALLSQSGNHMVGTFYCSGFDKYGEITFDEFKNQMNQVAATYGKNGSDNIWVASAKEVFEYLNLTKLITVNQNLNGNTLEITFSADNLPDNYRYYTLTILVTNDETITGMNVTGAAQSNYKYENSTALINLVWDGGNPPSIYETTRNAINLAIQNSDSAHCLIASDYIKMVSDADSVQKYQDELCGICTSVNLDFCDYIFDVPNDTICQGDTATLTAPDGMQSYLWSNDSTTQSILVSPDVTTQYWVEVVTTDGKTSRDTTEVIVFDTPVIIASQSDTVSIAPESTDTLWVSTADDVTYLWNTGNTDSSIIVPAPDEDDVSYYVDITKDYQVHQCSIRKNFVAQVLFESLVDFTWDTACFGDTATLIANITTNDSVVAVQWDLTESGEYDDATGDTIKHVFVRMGDILVGMRVVYNSGNMDVAYNVVPVADNPVVDFGYNNTCVGTTTLFHDSSKVNIGQLVQWDWDFGDGTTGSYNETSHYYQNAGNYYVKLVASSSFGCKDSISKSVNISQPTEPVLITDDNVTIGYNDTIKFAPNGVVIVNVQNVGAFDSTIWNGVYNGISYQISQEGSYSIVGYKEGCTSNKTFFAEEGSAPGPGPGPVTGKVMSLFTPNNDGYNDTWVINTTGITHPVKVTVYNRLGNEVYSSDNYQNDWNGYYKGNPLPQATYYYIIEDANGNIVKGPVTIIR